MKLNVSWWLFTLLLLTHCAACSGPRTDESVSERPVIKQKRSDELLERQRQMVGREEEPGRFDPLREPDLRQTCIQALARLGPAAVPALIDALRDPDPKMRESAARALARMGTPAKEAVEPLLRALQREPEPEVRKQEIKALGQMGELAAEAVPAIVDELRSAKK